MTVDYRVGDTRPVIKEIADGSIDFICSSPPFLALRSYVPAGHESKGDEIGSERNPAEFIDMLLGLTAEWGRVLAAHGSIAIELGDTYSGSGGAGGDYNADGLRADAPKFTGSARVSHRGDTTNSTKYDGMGMAGINGGTGWPRAKSLALIPQLYAVSLAYGINALTGQPSPAGRWLVRNVIVWHRPNPAVGALGDKVRPSTSYIVVATRSPRRWFDLTAVRTAVSANSHGGGSWTLPMGAGQEQPNVAPVSTLSNPAGAPPLDAWFDPYDGTHDTWTLTTQPSKLAHYAMWPAKLAERLVLSMCPREVCTVCGEPRRRMETATPQIDRQRALGNHLRQCREAKGLTVREVACHFPSRTGGLTGCVSNWEAATHIPTVEQWDTLKSLLGLSTEYDDLIAGQRSWTTDLAEYTDKSGRVVAATARDRTKDHTNGFGGHSGKLGPAVTRQSRGEGWTDCGHWCPTCDGVLTVEWEPGNPTYSDGRMACPDCGEVDGRAFRPGVVLDPFAGSGTTCAVADLHGRDAIGIDFDARNKAIYPARYDEVKRALFGTPAPMPGQETFDFAI